MADWSEGYIAVDWGTTNRRAYLLDPAGALRDQMEDDLGVTSVPAGGFEGAVAAIRQRLGERPMLLAGMIGSNRGWHEAPYVPCPADGRSLAEHLLWVDDRTAIVPGLSILTAGRADVMRGEEVQVFGLSRANGGETAICHPGTHTKWIRLAGGQVVDFRTMLTGELFSLLREHSILAPMLQEEPHAGPAFASGVEAARQAGGMLSAELFAVRAKVLLSEMAERDAASYLSGLLIGCDLQAGLALAGKAEIMVLGRPSLTRLYAAALEHCGRNAREADGAEAFIAGIRAIRESMP